MPRETQEARLQRYRDRISAARAWRENKGYVDTWRRMIDLYRGKQWATGHGEDDDLAMVNIAFAVHNVVLSSITTQYPKFTVAPNMIGQDDQATISEAVLNYSWKHYHFHPEFQGAVNDMCMIGHGWLKIGWHYKERTETVNLSPEEQFAQVMQGVGEASAGAGTGQPGLPSDEEIAAAVTPTQRQTVVEQDDPFVERVSPFDMLTDPEAPSERELTWIAQRTLRRLEDVREDPAYDARARRRVQADSTVSNPDDSYGDHRPGEVTGLNAEDEDFDRVTIWELYDLHEHEWCVFAEAGEGFLVKPTEIPTNGFENPYAMFRDYDVPDTFFPIGELESIESLQEELNKTRTQQINARKQYVRKFIGREAALNPKAREALASEIDGDVALVTDDDRPLNDLIIPAPSLSFDPQLFIAHSSQIADDIQFTTGLSDYQFGQMPDTRRLATEAMAVQGAVNARASFKQAKVERVLANVGRMLLQVLQQYMGNDRVARVAGPGGELLFTFSPEDIAGEFDLNVEAGSTQPKNDMIRRQEAVVLFNTLAPLIGTVVDPHQLVTYLLTQGYDIKNVERFFVQAPPPPPGLAPGAPGTAMPGGLGQGNGTPTPGPAPTNGATPTPALTGGP